MSASRPSGPLSAAELRARAVQALARRELTVQELVQRLSRLGSTPDAQAVVADLARAGLQSDARAAASRARDARDKRRAPARVLAELAADGVAPDVAQAAVDEAFAGVNVRAFLRAAAQPLLEPLAPRPARVKAARRLLAQGHDPDEVRRSLRLDDSGD